MADKNKILEIINKDRLPFEFIAKLLNISQSDYQDLEDTLAKMVEAGDLKYNANTGLYRKANKRRLTKEAVYEAISEASYVKAKSLVKYFNSSFKELDAITKELIKEGKIVYFSLYELYGIPKIAKIEIKDRGYGFAIVDGEEKNYYIAPDFIFDAYNGDTVSILPIGKVYADDNLESAVICNVIERAHKYIIGPLLIKGKKYPKYYIRSNKLDFNVTANVSSEEIKDLNVGQIVKADLVYDNYKLNAKNLVLVGNPNDPGIEITEIALEYGFELDFSPETEEEIKSIPDNVLNNEYNGREDYRDLNIITIDGDDSKDFDDAVDVELLNNGNYKLGVYIADVSHYVKEKTNLDKDALKRGTSVYLADRVIPMIPHKLSDGICSLVEGEDRLVLACIMEIDKKGHLVNYDIKEGVIKSKHRMTYKKVNKILNGDKEMCEEYKDIVPMINDMHELSKIIRSIRHKKGALDFDTAEYKFKLTPEGAPKSIEKCERLDAEMLIEDFMLKANETIAYHMNIMNLPIVYRIHEKPDQEKLHQILDVCKHLGVNYKNIKDDINPHDIQKILEGLDDNPNKEIINNMVLRGMMKAKYSDKCLGHYGLQMYYYCHFTSPIRRYPDLITHRMIKKLLLHPTDNYLDDIKKYSSLLGEIAEKNSNSEKKSVECERAVNDMLYAWYMSKRIGKEYDAIITSITSFGMFADIGNGIEGLIAYRNMDGFFEYNDKTLSASDGYITYHLGDKIKIRVIGANRMTRQIDFVLSEDYDLYDEDNMY